MSKRFNLHAEAFLDDLYTRMEIRLFALSATFLKNRTKGNNLSHSSQNGLFRSTELHLRVGFSSLQPPPAIGIPFYLTGHAEQNADIAIF
jgi:hypothetical protein